MTHRTGITLRLTPADRTALEALQAFTQERTARPGPSTPPLNATPTLPRIGERRSGPGPGPAGAAADPGRAGQGGKRAIFI